MGLSPAYLPGNASARSFSVRVMAPMSPSSSNSQRFTSLPARTLRCPFSHRSSSLSLRTPSAPPTSSLPSPHARFHGGVSGGGGGPPRHHKPDHHGKEGSSAFSLAALWRKISGQEEETEDQKRREEEEREVDYRKEAEDVQEQNRQMRVITWVGLGLNILLGTGKAIAGTVSAAPSRVRARGRVA